MFVDREAELESLENLFETPSAKLCRLYGRRRLGKTALLRQVLDQEGGLFFTIPEQSPQGILHTLNDEIERQTGRRFRYDTLADVLSELPDLLAEGTRMVVLDEFQRLRERVDGIESTIQAVWDNQLQDTNIILVLCGSIIGMMRQLNDARAPLHGRFAWDLHLDPLPYGAVRLFYPEASEEHRVVRYAVFGATPHYHRLAHELEIDSAIRRLFLDEGATLREEPRLLLELELTKPDRYQEILEALGAGCRRVGEIAGRYGEKASDYTPYVSKLRDQLGLLRSDDPLYGKNRNQRIHFIDPFFQFYYRFIYPNLSRLELGNVEGVLDDIHKQLTAHVGRPGFEQIARELLKTLNGSSYRGTRFDFAELGAWWDGEEELDAVAVGDERAYAMEAKFTKSPFDANDAATLQRRSRLFAEACNREEVVSIALTQSGYTPDVRSMIEADELLGLTLEDLDRIHTQAPP